MAPEAMLCRSSSDLPEGRGWVLEPKWDGYRFIYSVGPDRVQAHTRNGHPHGGRFPYLEAELREAFPAGAVVDGEIVALGVGPDGRPAQDFDLLGPIFAARPPHAPEACGLYYVAFDLLEVDGADLRPRPWRERRAALEQALPEPRGNVSVTPVTSCSSEAHEGHLAAGFEGSVGKRVDGRYLSRHRTWVKIKRRFELDATVRAVSWGRDGELHVLCGGPDGSDVGWAEVFSAPLRTAAAVGELAQGSTVSVVFSNRTARGRLREARIVALKVRR
ncbi:MAG: hypothetical protein J2P44_03545 [Candidatus Dormibacteraeota bacterium]|nr:hypothetical protein [Candidatus Dormibacteraeota bacterium]